MKTRYIVICLIIFLFPLLSHSQDTKVFVPNIKTIQLLANGQFNSSPLIHLHSNDQIEISFDELSHNYNQYHYEIKHVTADFTPSTISELDYLSGFYTNYIEEYETSRNTTIPYTHYKFKIPNENISFKLSGNYQIGVYDSNSNEPIFFGYFSIVDDRTLIKAQVTTNTIIDNNKSHQQVDFSVIHNGITLRNPQQEIKVRILQNKRNDNAVTTLTPTYISNNELQYTHNKKLIFDAGNEYRRFETVSKRNFGINVKNLEFIAPFHHAILYHDEKRNNSYNFSNDMNGHYLVRSDEVVDNDTEADYYWVHFFLKDEAPCKNGSVYLNGAFTYDVFNEASLMRYNWEDYCYETTHLLKQGSYNYQYLYVAPNSNRGESEPLEGNYAETENEYEIYIYYRAPNERYDQLIGFKNIRFKP